MNPVNQNTENLVNQNERNWAKMDQNQPKWTNKIVKGQ